MLSDREVLGYLQQEDLPDRDIRRLRREFTIRVCKEYIEGGIDYGSLSDEDIDHLFLILEDNIRDDSAIQECYV